MNAPDRIADCETIHIIGAGLAGSLLAIYLARMGFKVEVFERFADPRQTDTPAGRSINLALAERGIQALKGIGMHHRVGAIALPMRGRMVHLKDQPADHEPMMLPYGIAEDEIIYSVHREELNLTLIEAAEATQRVRVHFQQELQGLDLNQGTAVFFDHASNRRYERAVCPIIGADGVGSPVRQAISDIYGSPAVSQLLDHGYLELQLPPAADGKHAIPPEALHIWPRGDLMLIALPNTDGSFTATLFMRREGDPRSFDAMSEPAALRAFLGEEFSNVADCLVSHEDAPIGVMGTLYCDHWHHEGQAVVLGDAAHALVPFHGQGMNCAFEDVVELARCLTDSQDFSTAFARFQARREDNADAIAEMALENYHEMRSAVADPRYRLRRALEQELERRFPGHFVSRYSLVMFRTVDYTRARTRGRTNLEILLALTENVDRLEDVNWELASELVCQRLKPLR